MNRTIKGIKTYLLICTAKVLYYPETTHNFIKRIDRRKTIVHVF